MKIAAVGDIHFPKYSTLFAKALKEVPWNLISLLILVGDVIYKNNIKNCSKVLESIRNFYNGKIIGVFGNEEYEESEEELIETCRDITWLNNEKLNFKGIAIIGTRGVLDRPTYWQQKNIPNIYEKYRKRVKILEELIRETIKETRNIVFVSHYAVTYLTLKGEKEKIWPSLGSKRIEKILVKYKIPIAIHGHAHNSKIFTALVNGVKIYNAALPAVKKILVIDIFEEIKRGTLMEFLK